MKLLSQIQMVNDRVLNCEQAFLKETLDFVRDYKSFGKVAPEALLLEKHNISSLRSRYDN